MRRKRNERKEFFCVARKKLGKIVDWSKIILINFSPITNLLRPSFLLSFVANDTYEVVVCHADHTRFWTREKSDRRAVKHAM